MTKETLIAMVLIETRKKHIILASRELVMKDIIPKIYIDKLLTLDAINGKLPMTDKFTDEQRIEKINTLLQKHCFASTACLINELSQI